MNRRLLTILLSAFLIAVLSAFIVYKMVGSRIAAVKTQATTTVVAASADLKIGAIVSAPDLTQVQLVGAAPKGAFTDTKQVIGRGVVAPIFAGEPILDTRLAPVGSGGGLAATIKQGMRACAIKVDQVVGVAGFVTAGQHVDVLVSGIPPDAAQSGAVQNTQVHTILQNIEVLSAGTDIQKDPNGKPQQVQVVNLLVTPEQAQILALASNETKIQLVLRNPLDTKTDEVQSTEMHNLFGTASAPKEKPRTTAVKTAPKKADSFSVVVYNGSKKTEEKFAVPEGKQ
jgi:pilus assembly protein CpaB